MKTVRLLTLFCAFCLSVSAFAQFNVNPLVTIRPDAVTAQVYNPYYEPILCEGIATGLTFSGVQLHSRVADIIAPGQYRFAVVTTNVLVNPFVNGWAQVLCRFLR